MRICAVITMFALCLAPTALFAQTEEELKLARDVIQAEKKLTVSANMKLTDAEGTRFWPVYEKYQQDLQKLNNRTGKLIEGFAKDYQTLTDKKAQELLTEVVAIDEARLQLWKSYEPQFRKVMSVKKTARYYQIENKIHAMINYELTNQIPLAK